MTGNAERTRQSIRIKAERLQRFVEHGNESTISGSQLAEFASGTAEFLLELASERAADRRMATGIILDISKHGA